MYVKDLIKILSENYPPESEVLISDDTGTCIGHLVSVQSIEVNNEVTVILSI